MSIVVGGVDAPLVLGPGVWLVLDPVSHWILLAVLKGHFHTQCHLSLLELAIFHLLLKFALPRDIVISMSKLNNTCALMRLHKVHYTQQSRRWYMYLQTNSEYKLSLGVVY